MFENFVTFTEVVKLSSNIFHYLRGVNYSKQISSSILKRKDIISALQVLELIDDEKSKINIGKLIKRSEIEEVWELFCEVIKRKDISSFNFDNIILILVCICGSLYHLKILVDEGANIRDKNQHRPLLKSVEYGHLEIVKYIVEKGSYSVEKYNIYYQPIDFALKKSLGYGHDEISEYLRSQGADLTIIEI